MTETFCGKSCTECTEREQTNCPGCGLGPGKQYGGSCKIAKCVRTKGHETCETCRFQPGCGTYASRHQMPDLRRREAEAEAMRIAALGKKAPILGKWIWILFWLVVPSTIGSLMATDITKESMGVVYGAGELIQFACNLIYGVILLNLTSVNERYMTAGIYAVIGSFGGALIASFGDNAGLASLFSILVVAVGLYGEYSEYMAHASVLEDVDPELGQKWENLWKWYYGLNIGMLCSGILIIIPLIGPLAVLGIVIGILVIDILKLVYLYQTAKAFREF